PFLGRLPVLVYPEYLPDQRIPATTASGRSLGDPVVEAYTVRDTTPLPTPTPLPQRAGIIFGGRLVLTSVGVPAQVPAGGILQVATQWSVEKPPDGSYAVTLIGRDSHGYQLFAVTSIPHGGLLPTSDWVPGEVIEDTLNVPLSANVPPGQYNLDIRLVNLRTGVYLGVDGGAPEAHIDHIAVVAATPANRVQSVDPQLTYGTLRLTQVTVPAHPLAPGEPFTVTLLWHVEQRAAVREAFSIQLRSPTGTLLAQRDLQPGGTIPTPEWRSGLNVSNVVTLRVVPDAPSPSLALLSVYVYPRGHPNQPFHAQTVTGQPEPQPVVARLVVRSSGGQTPLPAPLPLRANVTFGQTIRLLSAAVPDHVEAGKSLDITLQWQAVRNPTADYTVFLHALDASGRLVFQLDARPQSGKLPTNDWVADEVVADHLAVPVPPSTAPGTYQIVVGLYQLQTGQRLLLGDGRSTYTLTHVTVVRPGGSYGNGSRVH
ncbi:MAG: hypothetical protein M1298_02120, partial [Chloroflexi bacterium]|nr:hypothetical protein [Chloroflexota bacterium]